MSTLSPVMSIAGAGLLPDPPTNIGVALTANTTFANAVATYEIANIVAQYGSILQQASLLNANIENSHGGSTSGPISDTTLNKLSILGSSNFPALTNVPSSGNIIANLLVYGTTANTAAEIYTVTGAVIYDTSMILGQGDLSRYCQSFQSAQGYVGQANNTLNSVQNSNILAQTFNPNTGGMNTLSTGGLNQVSNNLYKLSVDLSQLGFLIDLTNLDDLGLPGQLLAQIGKISGGTVPVITEFLQAQGIPDTQISDLSQGRNTLTSAQELKVYNAMKAVTGVTLSQVKLILGVTVSNIANMAQLLNVKSIVPNSYSTLLCPTNTVLVPIYLPNGSVNTQLEIVLDNSGLTLYTGPNNTNSLQELKKIIPPDQAVANKALARSLSQVKSITNSNLPSLASAMSVVEQTVDLPLVANLTTPIPTSVQTFYQNQLGQGTGLNGQVLLTDVIGLPTGVNFTNNFKIVANSIGNLTRSSSFTTLACCYVNMSDTLSGTFGNEPVIIPSGPGAGTYTDYNDAFQNGLIPAASSLIGNIVVAKSSEVAIANKAWSYIISNLKIQTTNQTIALLDYGNIVGNSQSAVMSFAYGLHDYGLDLSPGGANDVLVAQANQKTLSGQCIIASLREGRNIQSLQDAGIRLDTQLESTPLTVDLSPPLNTVPWSRTSSNWSKAATLIAADRNWGIYRSYVGLQITNWGFDGTPNQSGTVTVRASGKNVDVVIVDAVIDPAHPEFAVNVDGSGGSRVKYVNWYGLGVAGSPASTYNPPIVTNRPNSADDSRHACHVAGIAAGNTQGWAPNANIYNISPQYVTGGVQYASLYKYILAWHRAKKTAGNTNPTICNNSWYSRYTIPYTSITTVKWQGVTYTAPFTLNQLAGFGITNDGTGNCIVALRNAAMDADIQACIEAGIIMVACAGNDDTRIAIPGDVDYDNTLTATGFNSGNPIYYARGSSPVATPGVICVGGIGSGVTSGGDRKFSVSNCGPRVDIFAPGSYITSAWLTSNGAVGMPAPVPDPRNTAYYIAKDSGTSMASPQAAGILACALETSPDTSPGTALSYIVGASGKGQIPATNGGYTDLFSLQGAPNNYLNLPTDLRG